MIPNRANNAANWDFETLVTILIRQFKRPLTEHGIELTDTELRALGEKAAHREPLGNTGQKLRSAMLDIIQESMNVLKKWNLSFDEALSKGMDEMPGWETTAEFLDVANEKTNAELRISAGAALLAALGDTTHADKLWATYQHGKNDPEDVDAVIARRGLSFAAHLEPDDPQWQEKITLWFAAQQE